ncbi:hypothetical protein LIA77_08013 [Sarocladium implicatum]|nr:hypothetical protein LIA77_08013 [Sarocladium implicatum]
MQTGQSERGSKPHHPKRYDSSSRKVEISRAHLFSNLERTGEIAAGMRQGSQDNIASRDCQPSNSLLCRDTPATRYYGECGLGYSVTKAREMEQPETRDPLQLGP